MRTAIIFLQYNSTLEIEILIGHYWIHVHISEILIKHHEVPDDKDVDNDGEEIQHRELPLKAVEMLPIFMEMPHLMSIQRLKELLWIWRRRVTIGSTGLLKDDPTKHPPIDITANKII